MSQQSDVEFVLFVDKQQTLGHIEHYFVTRSAKSESSVRKKVLSLHGLQGLHGLHFGVTAVNAVKLLNLHVLELFVNYMTILTSSMGTSIKQYRLRKRRTPYHMFNGDGFLPHLR